MTISSCNALMGKHINMSLSPSSGSLLSGQLKVQDSPSAGFWAASGSLDAALAATVNAIGFVSGNLVSEVSIAGSGRTAIQNDVDANQVVTDAVMSSLGGLVNGSGVRVNFSGTNYIDGNASLSVDLTDLDQAIKDRADGLATLEGHLDNSNGFRVTSAAGAYRMSWGLNKPQMTMTLNADGETIDVCFDKGA